VRDRRCGGARPGNLFFLVAAAVLVVGAASLAPAPARAQIPAAAQADTVAAVEVVGNVTVDADLVRRGFGIVVGTRFSPDAVRRGIHRLYDLGFFSDIIVEGEVAPGGVILTLRVKENPRVSGAETSGLKHIKKEELEAITGPLTGRLADDRLLAQTQRRLRARYEKDGYIKAVVTPRYLPADSDTRRVLFIEVDEGKRIRVGRITFVGAKQINPDQLRSAMKQGTTGFFKKGYYQPDIVEDEKGRIEARMASLGFRDGKVTNVELVPDLSPDHMAVQVTIDEGPRYYVGNVSWEGNSVVPGPVLYGVTKLHSGEVFNQDKVQETESAVYELYTERGYIYLTVRPDYAVTDTVTDITFRIREGEPSHVHDVVITGNTRTKERVIRRQLAVRPGDLFRRSALVRSNRELQQLGYFNDVKIDSRPVAGSNDIDLVLDVEERQVGTASAGFGFSSSAGLTGFMELGHTNLFGNGQSLNLRMERGGARSNAELSFTEPWFRGSPTSVGMDLFSTSQTQRGLTNDLEVQRSGGALRLGRPLPWAYTRIYATYRLENQSITDRQIQVISDASLTSEVFVGGIRLDPESNLSSGVTLQLTRNSTDHPIYPTVGSLIVLRGEFTGGPLGGDLVYQKYEYDDKRYLKTIHMGGWKPILMLRTRLGMIGEVFRDAPIIPEAWRIDPNIPESDTLASGVVIPIPRTYKDYPTESYELFRLGGTSFTPLRGYEDAEIVPPENITRQWVVNQTGDRFTTRRGGLFLTGGSFMLAWTGEWEFPIADPLHGLIFTDWGGTWNGVTDFRWDQVHKSVGFGVRMEVPLLGLIGFDYGYGFDRLNESMGAYTSQGWQPHLQFGRVF